MKIAIVKNRQVAKKRVKGLNTFLAKKMGAPILYTPEVIDKIFDFVCQELMKGNSLKRILKDNPELPSNDSMYRILAKNPDLSEMVTRARAFGQIARIEEIEQLDELAKQELLNPSIVDPKVANAYVSLHKCRTGNMQWQAERFNPQQFSPKYQVNSNITPTIVNISIIKPELPPDTNEAIDVTPVTVKERTVGLSSAY